MFLDNGIRLLSSLQTTNKNSLKPIMLLVEIVYTILAILINRYNSWLI